MGKASKWFRGLLGLKKPDSTTTSKPPQNKRHWSLLKSFRERDPIQKSGCVPPTDADHAISVAAANADVNLTSNGRVVVAKKTAPSTEAVGGAAKSNGNKVYVSRSSAGYGSREEWAAVEIQSHFRAYLSRRALRALKALVRLQALVRGSIVRKDNANRLQRWEQVLKAQARARAGRVAAQIVESSLKSNQLCYPGPATPEKFEHVVRVRSTRRGDNMAYWGNPSISNGNIAGSHDKANWKDNSVDLRSWEEQQGESSTRTTGRDHERILEIDDCKFHVFPKRRNLFHSSHLNFSPEKCSHHSFTMPKEPTPHEMVLSPLSCELHANEEPYFTADCSPQILTASSKGHGTKVGAFTPTKSDGSISCLSGYSDNPSYMSYTESSKAKMRSLSAPKQRPQYERSSSTRRCLLQGYAESRLNNQRVMQANFTSKAYPGSGRLDRLGMPIREETIGFSGGGHWNNLY